MAFWLSSRRDMIEFFRLPPHEAKASAKNKENFLFAWKQTTRWKKKGEKWPPLLGKYLHTGRNFLIYILCPNFAFEMFSLLLIHPVHTVNKRDRCTHLQCIFFTKYISQFLSPLLCPFPLSLSAHSRKCMCTKPAERGALITCLHCWPLSLFPHIAHLHMYYALSTSKQQCQNWLLSEILCTERGKKIETSQVHDPQKLIVGDFKRKMQAYIFCTCRG